MFQFGALIFKNLSRNRLRTALTALAVTVLVAVYGFVSSTTAGIRALVSTQASETRLVVTERWMAPSRFPMRYVSKIAETPGVDDWTTITFYPGYFDDSRRNWRRGTAIATRPDNLYDMYSDLKDLDPAAALALQEEKTGALIGPEILEMMNWKVGTRFRFVSRSIFGTDIPLKIVGVLPAGLWDRGLVFRSDYYKDLLGNHDTVNLMYLRVRDEQTGKRLASQIEKQFARHQPEVKVETESSAVARFVGRNAAVLAVMNAVVAVLLADVLLVLGNSISISTQERRQEMAVLKVIGFQPRQIVLMIVAEAVLISATSSAVGATLVYAISELNNADLLPTRIGFLTLFPVSPTVIAKGLILGTLLGIVGSALPAWRSRKIRVADVFSQVV